MFEVLIDQVKVLDMHSGEESLKKVGIKGNRIAAILPYSTAPVIARKVIDGKGAYLFPGFIDFHTHLFQHGSGFGMDGDQLLPVSRQPWIWERPDTQTIRLSISAMYKGRKSGSVLF